MSESLKSTNEVQGSPDETKKGISRRLLYILKRLNSKPTPKAPVEAGPQNPAPDIESLSEETAMNDEEMEYEGGTSTTIAYENGLNEKLTPMQDLKRRAMMGEKESSVHTEIYEGKPIRIYDLGNQDADILVYPIQDPNYDKSDGKLADNPSNWGKAREKDKSVEDARNILRTRVYGTEALRMHEQSIKGIGYGFEKIKDETLVDIPGIDYSSNSDKWIEPANIIGGIGKATNLAIKYVRQKSFVFLRKFNKENRPIYRPDYITMHARSCFEDDPSGEKAYQGELNAALKHAAYFGVDIVELRGAKAPTKEDTLRKTTENIIAVKAQINETVSEISDMIKYSDIPNKKWELDRLQRLQNTSSADEEWGMIDSERYAEGEKAGLYKYQLYRPYMMLRDLIEELEELQRSQNNRPKDSNTPESTAA